MTPDAPPTLVERAIQLEARTQILRRRRAAEADAYAIDDALKQFTKLRDDLKLALEHAALATKALEAVPMPNRRRVLEAVADLADRVEADPVAARNRGEAYDQLNGWVTAVASDARARLGDAVVKARGGAEAGLVAVLRTIGLKDAASTLATSLGTLDRYAANLPVNPDELAEVQQAAEAITSTMQALDDPRYRKLLHFVRASMSTKRPTLMDIDPELLAELQATGAAANFVIAPRTR